MLFLGCLCFDCGLSHTIRCESFYLWHPVVTQNIDIGTFQSPKFQGRDASLPEWIGDFICY